MTRSRAMKEQLEVFISFDTSLEDIEALRKEMEAFVRRPENTRDFQPDVIVECTGIGNMDKLSLKVEIRHKSNWANETVRASRRSKFMCALVLAIRKVPIYGPGAGGAPLGDPSNPAYSVAVSDEVAAAAREKAAKDKEAQRLIPTVVSPVGSPDVGKSSGLEKSAIGSLSEGRAAQALNVRSPTDDVRLDDSDFDRDDEGSGDVVDRKRSHEIEDLRQGLIKRQSTRGRRRLGVTAPQRPTSAGGQAYPAASPNPLARIRDEEADVGMTTGMGGVNYLGSAGQQSGPAFSVPPPGHGLQHQHTAPPTSHPARPRGMGAGGRP